MGINDDSIIKPIIETSGPKATKVIEIPHGGHMFDQFLRTDQKKEEFLKKYKLQHKYIVTDIDRIKLTVMQRKIITAFYINIYKQFNPGESEQPTTSFADILTSKEISFPMQELRIPRGDFYRDILRKNNYSSDQQTIIHKNLYALNTTRFQVLQKIEYQTKTKGKQETKFNIFYEKMSLIIRLVLAMENLTQEEAEREISLLFNGEMDNTKGAGDFIVTLNPILTLQLSEKYVNQPIDVIQRMNIAVEEANAETEAMYNLMDYMFRERSAKRYSSQIGIDKLYELLNLDSYIKRRHERKALERIEDAFKVCKSIGVCNDYKLSKSSKDQGKYEMEINKDLPNLDKVETVIFKKRKK